MKRLLDLLQGIVAWLVVIPVAIICADTALVFLDARPENPVVAFLRVNAERLTPNPVADVLADQQYWQTALFSLAAYGVVLLLFAGLFRGLRAAAVRLEPYGSRP